MRSLHELSALWSTRYLIGLAVLGAPEGEAAREQHVQRHAARPSVRCRAQVRILQQYLHTGGQCPVYSASWVLRAQAGRLPSAATAQEPVTRYVLAHSLGACTCGTLYTVQQVSV